ncbi:hypothetical protein FKM82_025115 [Ascaphus truei]
MKTVIDPGADGISRTLTCWVYNIAMTFMDPGVDGTFRVGDWTVRGLYGDITRFDVSVWRWDLQGWTMRLSDQWFVKWYHFLCPFCRCDL